jgi:mono/diheme cytochrome c family protein
MKIVLRFFACCALLAILECGSQAGAQTQKELSPQEMKGERIYQWGEGDGDEIIAILGSGLEVPATTLRCANCHGNSGEGRSEGGIRVPPIYWESLTSGGTSSQTRPRRKAYDEQSLARAIREGVDPDSRSLNSAMPHYRLTSAQMADLIAYLKTLQE